MVKISPLVYMSYPEPYCFIIWTDISYLELFWALSNGEFVWGRYLSSTDLSPLRTHYLLATKCLAYQLPTPGIDIHLRQTIPLKTKPKISKVNISISNGLSRQCSLPITLSLWSVGYLLKKNWSRSNEKKRETRPIPPLKRVEIRGSNKKTKNFLSVSPFAPSPLNILPSIRSGFDRVPTSCEPLFGSATQVTKVCYTLPT